MDTASATSITDVFDAVDIADFDLNFDKSNNERDVDMFD